MSETDIRRGHFYLADLDPRRGTEPGKTRPVLVLQTDLLNQTDHFSTLVLPLTTRIIPDTTPLRVHIPAGTPGFSRASDILIDQLRAIDNQRLYHPTTGKLLKCIGPAPTEILAATNRCVRLVLDLP